ncbi:MAG: carboxy terminal-processing peptidase [Candidatus Competibacterales bacterium]
MHKKLLFCLRWGLALGAGALVIALGVARAIEGEAPISVVEIDSSDRYRNLDQTIAGLLTHYHYRQTELDDRLSAVILDSYLEALDPNRGFFLREDVDQFQRKYRFSLDNHLQAGNLRPAFEIYNVYLRRLAERTARTKLQLQRPFNFELDESYDLDRKQAPWVESRQELDEVWRKRLKNELLVLMLGGKSEAEARDTLVRRYESRLKRSAQSTSEDVFQLYVNAMSHSFDPHTAYFSPRASENFNIQMSLSLEGIGTVLRMEDEQITVVKLVPGGPADLSNQLAPDDQIIGVGQGGNGNLVDVVGWRLDDVVDLIRGRRGTVVRLKILPAEGGANAAPKIVRLVRDEIKLEEQAAQGEVQTLSHNGRQVDIGLIDIPAFYSDFAAAQRGDRDYRSTTRDVRRLLEDLKDQNVDGVVVDLRQNGGGSLQEAVELTGLFIDQGPVVQVRNSRGNIEVETDPDPELVYDGPLLVLVNRFSASASEIFAGAIQDYGRGVVMGAPTIGKGTVPPLGVLNRFVPMGEDPLGQLKLTIAKFYRINGSSTQHRGVIPDIRIPSPYGPYDAGESAQETALPWDEISALNYRGSRYLDSIIPELRRRHQERMHADTALRLFRQDVEEARQARQNTVVSLQRSAREAEQTHNETRRRQRENLWRSARGLEPLENDEALPEREEDDEGPDLIRDESMRILADMIELLRGKGGYRALVMN